MAPSLRPAPVQRDPLTTYLELRMLWKDSPTLYVRQRFGIDPTWQQQRILEAIVPYGAKVSVRSGHGIGKSATAAWIVSWLLETHDYAKVPCTAPSSHQLRDILWGELSKWRRKADELSRQRGDHPRFSLTTLFRLMNDSLIDPSAKEWGAFARTARKENPEALQGFHANELLFVVDEASAVPEEVFEAAEGALSTPGARVLMLGNPTRTSGTFHASHHKDRGSYTALHFRSQDSPLVDSGYRPRLVAKWGEGSNVVRVRADGEFPRQEDDMLISLEWTEPCLTREVGSGEGLRKLGVDVARFGSDRTVLLLRQGRCVTHIQVYAKQDTMATVGAIMAFIEPWAVDEIDVDVIGLGAGVYDRLVELRAQHRFTCAVVDVNVAMEAPEKPTKGEPRPRRLRDYLWLAMARWLREDAPAFGAANTQACEDLAGELSSVRYGLDSNGCIVVEDKDAMRKRLGHSPDCFVAGTLVRTPTGLCPIERLAVGDSVSTPMGPRTILHCWRTRTAALTTVHFSNGSCLIGKGKHQIFTWDSGWIRLDALSLVNTIESDTAWRRYLWKCLAKWCMPVKPFGFKHQVDIISQGREMRRRDFFIDASIWIYLGRFLMDMRCITGMGSGRIMPLRIWSLSRQRFMRGSTCWDVGTMQKIRHTFYAGWPKLARQLKRGMPQTKDAPGIITIVSRHGKIAPLLTSLVSSVVQRLAQYSRREHGIVPMPVTMPIRIKGIKQLLASVFTAVKRLSITSIVIRRVAPVSVQSVIVPAQIPVYNLTLDGDNVYYANGILVANCADALGCTFMPVLPRRTAGTWGQR